METDEYFHLINSIVARVLRYESQCVTIDQLWGEFARRPNSQTRHPPTRIRT
jgi:hypothetical protein